MVEGEKYYIVTDTEHEDGVESIIYISKDRDEVLKALGRYVLENIGTPELLLAAYIFINGRFEFFDEVNS